MINCLKPPLLTANNAVKYIPMNGLEYKRSAKVSLLFNNTNKKYKTNSRHNICTKKNFRIELFQRYRL